MTWKSWRHGRGEWQGGVYSFRSGIEEADLSFLPNTTRQTAKVAALEAVWNALDRCDGDIDRILQHLAALDA